MNKRNHNGLILTGIIITYIATYVKALCILLVVRSGIHLQFEGTFPYDTILTLYLILAPIILLLTVLYHVKVIKSYVLIGLLAFLTFSPIGGILILIGGDKKTAQQPTQLNANALQTNLKKLEDLLEKGVLTKEEYEARRKFLIEKSKI